MSSAGIVYRQIRGVQPSAQALETSRIIQNALDFAMAPRYMPTERPLNLKAIKAINDICNRYDEVVDKKTPPASWESERDLNRILGHLVKNPELFESRASVISQACSTLTRRNTFLNHLSYSILSVAYKLELERINTALDTVMKFLSRRGLIVMSKSIRAAKNAVAHRPSKEPRSPGSWHLEAGATTICTLRREADWLSQRKEGPGDARTDAMVQLLEECATAAGKVYRLAIELEVMKFDDDVDFRTKKLNVREAFELLHKPKCGQTRAADAGTG